MKYLILLSALIFTGCSVSTSGNINVNTDSIKYVKDQKTGLCFAFVASRRALTVSTTGLGFTQVSCEDAGL